MPWRWRCGGGGSRRTPGWSITATGDRKVNSTGRRNTLISEVCDVATADWSLKTSDVPEGRRRQWRADHALRPAMRSPGRPDPSRVVQRQFWRLIATGVTTVEASLAVGVSWPQGVQRQFGPLVVRDLPADDHPRVHVQDERHVRRPRPGTHIRSYPPPTADPAAKR